MDEVKSIGLSLKALGVSGAVSVDFDREVTGDAAVLARATKTIKGR
jgi:hypothetical protein